VGGFWPLFELSGKLPQLTDHLGAGLNRVQ
jgi:hypothetical protein